MLAKLTSKNQITLPKAAVSGVDAAEYFDVTVARTAESSSRRCGYRKPRPCVKSWRSSGSPSRLLRVLAYPRFKLTASEQEELLADFLPCADVVELPSPWPDLPACRDERDQVFLVLAYIGKADALVTADADLLALREAFPGLISTAEELAARAPSGVFPRARPTMTAAQALAGLRPVLTPRQAADWLRDSRGAFDEDVRDPWA